MRKWDFSWPDDLPSIDEMRVYDKNAVLKGTPSLLLMERAGEAIAKEVAAQVDVEQEVLVLCGPGNNGGDGLVLTRHLREMGYKVTAVLCCSGKLSQDTIVQASKLGCLKTLGVLPDAVVIKDNCLIEPNDLRRLAANANVIIDALLGAGQCGLPRDGLAETLQVLSEVTNGKFVVSIDVPTGVNAETGEVYVNAVEASRTYAIECIKRGLSQYPARRLCGEMSVVSIGIDLEPSTKVKALHDATVIKPSVRAGDVHKGQLGKILIIGGSRAMPGAGMLAALGALRAGAGIVSRVVRTSWPFVPSLPECMFEVLEGDEPTLSERDLDGLISACENCDAVVVGPGLGYSRQMVHVMRGLIEGLSKFSGFVVYDADALNCLADFLSEVSLGSNAIVTPHPGEAARLLGTTSAIIQNDRFSAAHALSDTLGCTVVLKGAGSIITDGCNTHVLMVGDPILATPGSGDVLSGLIATAATQINSALGGACYGGWIHASAGELLASSGQRTALASNIADAIGRLV